MSRLREPRLSEEGVRCLEKAIYDSEITIQKGKTVTEERRKGHKSHAFLERFVGLPKETIQRIRTRQGTLLGNIEALCKKVGFHDWEKYIVSGDAGTDGDPPLADAPPSAQPHQYDNLRKLSTLEFIGRNAELAQLRDWLQETPQPAQRGQHLTIAIHGAPGVGKTELALRYAWRYYDAYPGGICWVDAGEADLAAAIVQEARIFVPFSPAPSDAPIAQVRLCWKHWTPQEGQVLLIFDDVQDYDALDTLLGGLSSRFHVLITTRQTLPGHRISQNLPLPPLAPEDAWRLLSCFLAEGDERRNEGRDIVDALCGWLDHLPLALCLVGGYLAWNETVSLPALYERLQQTAIHDEAFAATRFTAVKRGLIAAFDLTWQQLEPGEQQLGCLLSLFADAAIAHSWLAQAMTAVPTCIPQPGNAQRTLRQVHLLTQDQPEFYRLGSLTRQYLQERGRTLETLPALQQALCTALTQTIETVALPERPLRTDLDRFKPLAPHLEHALLSFSAAFADAALLSALTQLRRFYQGQGLYQHALHLCERLLPEIANRFGAVSREVASLHRDCGSLLCFLHQFDNAEKQLTSALTLYRQADVANDAPELATVLIPLAATCRNVGQFGKAQDYATQALAICYKLWGEEHLETAECRLTLGTVYLRQDLWEAAERELRAAASVREQLWVGNHPDCSESWNALGVLYEQRQQWADAAYWHQRALALNEQILGDKHPLVAFSHNNLGKVCLAQSDTDAAEEHFRQAVELLQDGDDRVSYAWCRMNLAGVYAQQGEDNQSRLAEARQILEDSYKILRNCVGEADFRTGECYKRLQALPETPLG